MDTITIQLSKADLFVIGIAFSAASPAAFTAVGREHANDLADRLCQAARDAGWYDKMNAEV